MNNDNPGNGAERNDETKEAMTLQAWKEEFRRIAREVIEERKMLREMSEHEAPYSTSEIREQQEKIGILEFDLYEAYNYFLKKGGDFEELGDEMSALNHFAGISRRKLESAIKAWFNN
jgi:hypothetical protein